MFESSFMSTIKTINAFMHRIFTDDIRWDQKLIDHVWATYKHIAYQYAPELLFLTIAQLMVLSDLKASKYLSSGFHLQACFNSSHQRIKDFAFAICSFAFFTHSFNTDSIFPSIACLRRNSLECEQHISFIYIWNIRSFHIKWFLIHIPNIYGMSSECMNSSKQRKTSNLALLLRYIGSFYFVSSVPIFSKSKKTSQSAI